MREAREDMVERQLVARGIHVKAALEAMREGRLGIGALDFRDVERLSIKIGGQVHGFGPGGLPVVVTYHPAYLLRSPREKAKSWQDLKRLRDVLRS